MSTETLEEAEKVAKLKYGATIYGLERVNAFKAGAQCQAERMYSQEEVEVIAKDAYTMGRNNILIGVFNEWFEQFKKK